MKLIWFLNSAFVFSKFDAVVQSNLFDMKVIIAQFDMKVIITQRWGEKNKSFRYPSRLF